MSECQWNGCDDEAKYVCDGGWNVGKVYACEKHSLGFGAINRELIIDTSLAASIERIKDNPCGDDSALWQDDFDRIIEAAKKYEQLNEDVLDYRRRERKILGLPESADATDHLKAIEEHAAMANQGKCVQGFIQSYGVKCSKCGHIQSIPVSQASPGVFEIDDLNGWSFTTDDGWLCPNCQPKDDGADVLVVPHKRKQLDLDEQQTDTPRRYYHVPEQAVFSVLEVSKICEVAPRTVSKWFDSGRLKGYRIPGSQDRRIPRDKLLEFIVNELEGSLAYALRPSCGPSVSEPGASPPVTASSSHSVGEAELLEPGEGWELCEINEGEQWLDGGVWVDGKHFRKPHRRRVVMTQPPDKTHYESDVWFYGKMERQWFWGAAGSVRSCWKNGITAWCHRLDGEQEPPQFALDWEKER